jgi:hypothetical protein
VIAFISDGLLLLVAVAGYPAWYIDAVEGTVHPALRATSGSEAIQHPECFTDAVGGNRRRVM